MGMGLGQQWHWARVSMRGLRLVAAHEAARSASARRREKLAQLRVGRTWARVCVGVHSSAQLTLGVTWYRLMRCLTSSIALSRPRLRTEQ